MKCFEAAVVSVLFLLSLLDLTGSQETTLGEGEQRTTSSKILSTTWNDAEVSTPSRETFPTEGEGEISESLLETSSTNFFTTRKDLSATDKLTTLLPTYSTEKGFATGPGDFGSTPRVDAVYEEVPESVGPVVTDTSLIASRETQPIYVRRPGDERDSLNQEICDFCVYEGEGNFTSYGYPLPYRANLNCSYRIQRVDDTDVCELELIFHDFDVPVSSIGSSKSETNDCQEDYLEVHGRRFCGNGWRGKSEVVPFPVEHREVTFYFRSNERVSGRGFWVEVKRKTGSCFGRLAQKGCEERYSEPEFHVTSPRFPGNYPNNADCTFYIRKNNNNICGLEMTFMHFDIEPVNGCFYDFLEIDGQKVCGTFLTNSKKVIPFNEDQKVVLFHSDKQVARTGFHIRVRQITHCEPNVLLPPPPSCNVCTNEKSGSLVSYSYPSNYRNNLLCTYTIDRKGPEYCALELVFDNFDIDPSVDCVEDYLQVSGQRYCGTTLHSIRKLLTFGAENSINFLFKTDGVSTSKGFSIKYKQLMCTKQPGGDSSSTAVLTSTTSFQPQPAKNEHHHCDYVFSEKGFYVKSENYSFGYANNMDCNYYIKRNTSKVCYLELTFLKFDIEASPQCQFDYVEINNVRLCGSLAKETTRTYIFESKDKLIKFHSDSSTARSGYLIKVDQLECEGDVIVRGSTTPRPPITPTIGSSSSSATTAPKSCNQFFQGLEFEVRSPSYSRPYPSNIECMYYIKKLNPNVCRLEVTYYDFELQEPDPNGYCKYDFLDFNGIRMCGHVIKGEVRHYYFPENEFRIRFVSDGTVTAGDNAFRIGVRQSECGSNVIGHGGPGGGLPRDASPQQCNHVFNDVTFEIKSPRYPTAYPENLDCKYTVVKRKNGTPICQLEVHFVEFGVDDTYGGCRADHLSFDGQPVCGSLPPEHVRFFPFDRQEFVITFKSDESISSLGYYMRVRQRECPDALGPPAKADPAIVPKTAPSSSDNKQVERCGQVFLETDFEIRSPSYPSSYGNDLDCQYIIKRNNNRICSLDLRFIDFELEEGGNCEYDYLMIDGKKMCGRYQPNSVLSFEFTAIEKRVVFRSDGARARRGFLIMGQQKECERLDSAHHDTAVAISPSICELCFADVSGTIKSYDFPNNYPPNLTCKYRVTGLPGYCSVELRFDDFIMESSRTDHCVDDFLEINGARYCGSQLNGVTKILPFVGHPKEAVLRFTSNAYINAKGFRANYYQIPCQPGQAVTTPIRDHQPVHVNVPAPVPGVITTGSHSITVVDIGAKSPGAPSSPNPSRVPCDLAIYDMYFEVSSPGYPYTYPFNQDCLYSIRRINARICKLRLQFVDFDIEPTPACTTDYLEVGGQRLCGVIPNDTMKEYDFQAYKIAMRFGSDGYGSRKGFFMKGQQVECAFGSFPPSFQPPYPLAPSESFFPDSQGRTKAYPPVTPPMYPPYHPSSSYYPPAPDPSPAVHGRVSPPPPVPAPPATSPSNDPYHRFQSTPQSSQYPQSYPSSSPNCDRVINNTFFEMRSPGFPFSYPVGSKCSFTIIKSGDNVCHLDLLFATFEVGDSSCRGDFLSVDGEKVCGSLSGEKMMTFRFDLNEKLMHFKGDKGQGLGFHIRGRQVECGHFHLNSYHNRRSKQVTEATKSPLPTSVTPSAPLAYCDQTFSSSEFTIMSPKHPEDYPSNLFCRFTIRRPSSSTCALEIKFINFDLEDSLKCDKDYLEIDTGKICGLLPPNHERRYYYFSQENEKVLTFRTDSTTFRSGFSIQVKQTTDCNRETRPAIAPPVTCDMCLHDVRGHITSSNYPNKYEDYFKCTYRIQAASANYCQVRLYLRDVDIQSSPSCDKDYLYVKGERICGENLASREILLHFPEYPNREVQLNFITDSSDSRRGFYIEYVQELCPEPKGGIGHSYDNPGKTALDGKHDLETHRAGSFSPPEYPPNYVAKATLEEIVETRVQVLDSRDNFPSASTAGSPQYPSTVHETTDSTTGFRRLTAIDNSSHVPTT